MDDSSIAKFVIWSPARTETRNRDARSLKIWDYWVTRTEIVRADTVYLQILTSAPSSNHPRYLCHDAVLGDSTRYRVNLIGFSHTKYQCVPPDRPSSAFQSTSKLCREIPCQPVIHKARNSAASISFLWMAMTPKKWDNDQAYHFFIMASKSGVAENIQLPYRYMLTQMHLYTISLPREVATKVYKFSKLPQVRCRQAYWKNEKVRETL